MRGTRRPAGRAGGVAVVAVVLLASVARAQSQDPADFFKTMCIGCHTIGGGRLVGPDLKNVTERKDRPWLVRFLRNPPGMIKSGDPYAEQLLAESRGVVMPVVGVTPEYAGKLLDLIEAESQLPKSRFVGTPLPSRPVTEADVEKGRKLFFGEDPLTHRGPACVMCHSVRGPWGVGGGKLGGDLTTAYTRLGGPTDGRRNVLAWLAAPGTPVMASLYAEGRQPLTADESLALTAFLQSRADGEG
ncbi:MAG: hypothetical protein U0736_24905, partial [Gemmataceae bacterium]